MGCQSQKKKKSVKSVMQCFQIWMYDYMLERNLGLWHVWIWIFKEFTAGRTHANTPFSGGNQYFFYKFLEKIYMLTLLSRLCINIFNEYKYKKHLWNLHLYWKPKIRKKRKSTLISCMSVKFYAYICKKGQDNVSKLRDLFCVHE